MDEQPKDTVHERTVTEKESSSTSTIVAIVVILALIILALLAFQAFGGGDDVSEGNAPVNTPSLDTDVNAPAPATNGE